MSAPPAPRSAVPLRVHPNPYAALDVNGKPAGTVHFDPEHNMGNDVAHIGAVIARKPRDGSPLLTRRVDNRDTVFSYKHTFDLAAVEIPRTDYHVRQIKDGSLLCADAGTARAAGVKFVDPVTALAASRALAIADWVANYGVEPPTETWDDFEIPGSEPALGTSTETTSSASAKVDVVGAFNALTAKPNGPSPSTVVEGTARAPEPTSSPAAISKGGSL